MEYKKEVYGINIPLKNEAKIDEVLKLVQKRAKVRTVDCSDLYRICSKIERKLNIPKKYMEGIEAECDIHAQDFPSSYFLRSNAESTTVNLLYHNGWRLISARRDVCKKSGNGYSILLPPMAKMKILSQYERF